MFNLEQAVLEWRRKMLAADIKAPAPLDELEIHLRDEIDRQMKSGLNAQEAFEAASKQLGQARALKEEFAKADNSLAGFRGSFIAVGMIFLAFVAALNIFGAGDYGGVSGWKTIGVIDFLLLSLVLPLMAGFNAQENTANKVRVRTVRTMQLLMGLGGLLMVFSQYIGDGVWIVILSCLIFVFQRRLQIRGAVASSIAGAGLVSAAGTRILFWRPAGVEMNLFETVLGLVGIGLGILLLCSWPYSYRLLPVVSRKPMRKRIQLAFGAVLITGCVMFSNFITTFFNGAQSAQWVVALVWSIMIPLGVFGGIVFGLEEAARNQTEIVAS